MIRILLHLSGLLVLFMIAGGIPVADGAQTVVFRTPVFVLLMAGAGGLLIWALWRHGRSWRGLWFWPSHVGPLLVLVGAGLGSLYGVRGKLVLPVGMWHQADSVATEHTEERTPLGFGLAVASFDVDHFPPTYTLFKPSDEAGPDDLGYAPAYEVPAPETDAIELQGYGRVPRDALWDSANASWLPGLRLENDWVLQRNPLTPRKYEALLHVTRDSTLSAHPLRVNNPVSIDGWRIYLMSHGSQPRPHVQLLLRRDPFRKLVIAGFWLMIVGTPLLCWRPERRGQTRGKRDNAASAANADEGGEDERASATATHSEGAGS